jgi:rhamnulokinase
MKTHYLACDLGAESGRLMLGTLEDGRLTLTELHRFPNTPIDEGDRLLWNLPALLDEVTVGLKKAAALGVPIASISADSWGVDYVLYDEAGARLDPVHHYRDARTAQGVEHVLARLSWPQIFAETGLQFLPFNTLFQLAAESPDRLASADRILGVGDAFNHWLGGRPCYEESLASTTQLYDPRIRGWSRTLLEAVGLRTDLFPAIVPSGTRLGALRAELAAETGLEGVEVVASCSHDTGAAVAAVPAQGDDWAYLSSGTWSLMGVELSRPVLDDRVRELNFTNEIGVGGSVRFLKNIIGLWMVQECRREWARQGQDYDYAALAQRAAEAPAFAALVNPADPRFVSPGDMPGKIAAFCREHGQAAPTTPGAFIRCILESLALLYRRTLRQLASVTGRKLGRLHIVGGGSRNVLLNQFAANACQVPVITGPVEATAAGNVLVQAIGLGHLPSLAAAREVVRNSFDTETVEPADAAVWDAANARFEPLLEAHA